MSRCEDEQMWRWTDVKMSRCEDEQMWRWEGVKMSRCEDEQMWRWADVKMSRCEDEQMWRWADVKMSRCEDEQVWRWADVKMRRWDTDPHYWKNPALRRSREKNKKVAPCVVISILSTKFAGRGRGLALGCFCGCVIGFSWVWGIWGGWFSFWCVRVSVGFWMVFDWVLVGFRSGCGGYLLRFWLAFVCLGRLLIGLWWVLLHSLCWGFGGFLVWFW